MNVISRFTRRNLTRNRKRTFVTIIGVMLSTALICTVVGMVATFRHSIIEDYKRSTGDYHVEFGIRNKEQYDILMNNAHVEKAGTVQTLAFAKLDPVKTGREYLTVYGLDDMAFVQMNIELLEGRLPENASEMVLTEHYASMEGAPKVGDTLRIEIGDRVIPDEENGGEIPYYGWESAEEEQFISRGEAEYKVVGIVENRYSLEHSGSCTAFVREEDFREKYSEIYIRFDDPVHFSEYMDGISEVLESIDEGYDFSTSMLVRYEGGFTDSYMRMVVLLGTIISLIIVGTSVFVISNGFRISVEDKKTQLGMLASVGATKRQIRGIVLREGLYIFLIGTTAGIALGAFVIWVLDQVVNLLLKKVISFGMIYTFPWWVAAFSVALSAVTILLASILPARKAARITPIDVIRGTDEIQTDGRSLKVGRKTKKLFGIGGVIAEKNLKRSRRKYRTTVVSLVIGISTFIAISGFVDYGKRLVGEAYSEYDSNLEISVVGEDDQPDPETIRHCYAEIRNLPGIRNSGFGIQSDGELSLDAYASASFADRVKEYGEEESFSVNIMILPEKDFGEYLSRIGVKTNTPDKVAILADCDIYYDVEKDVKTRRRVSRSSAGDEVTFSYVSGLREITQKEAEEGVPDRTYSESTCRVEKVVLDGEGDELPLGFSGFFREYGGLMLFISEKHFPKLPALCSIQPLYVDAVDAEAAEKAIAGLEQKDGFRYRIFNIEAQRQQNHRMILVLEIFLYGFLIVIVLIGLTNIVNTINTNMNLRSREFAMLRSVGMTQKEFIRMIRLEGLLYSLRSLVIGIPLGVLLSGLIYLAIRSRINYGYVIPWAAIIISVFAVILIVWLIMWSAVRRIRKQNIIETIRKQNY